MSVSVVDVWGMRYKTRGDQLNPMRHQREVRTLEGHPGGHLIMFYLPERSPRGHLRSTFFHHGPVCLHSLVHPSQRYPIRQYACKFHQRVSRGGVLLWQPGGTPPPVLRLFGNVTSFVNSWSSFISVIRHCLLSHPSHNTVQSDCSQQTLHKVLHPFLSQRLYNSA